MRDSMKPVRLAINTLINGVVTYKGNPVKCYDEKVFTGQVPDIYILYSTQQETPGPDQTDCTFNMNSSIDIEIISRTGSEVSKDVLDDVSNDIMQLVVPTQGTAGFTLSGFQIINAARESAITQNITITESQSILRKIVRFVFNLVQQN